MVKKFWAIQLGEKWDSLSTLAYSSSLDMKMPCVSIENPTLFARKRHWESGNKQINRIVIKLKSRFIMLSH